MICTVGRTKVDNFLCDSVSADGEVMVTLLVDRGGLRTGDWHTRPPYAERSVVLGVDMIDVVFICRERKSHTPTSIITLCTSKSTAIKILEGLSKCHFLHNPRFDYLGISI